MYPKNVTDRYISAKPWGASGITDNVSAKEVTA